MEFDFWYPGLDPANWIKLNSAGSRPCSKTETISDILIHTLNLTVTLNSYKLTNLVFFIVNANIAAQWLKSIYEWLTSDYFHFHFLIFIRSSRNESLHIFPSRLKSLEKSQCLVAFISHDYFFHLAKNIHACTKVTQKSNMRYMTKDWTFLHI